MSCSSRSIVAVVTPSSRWRLIWPVKESVLPPDQPNHRPRDSLSAAASATASPPWVPSTLRGLGDDTRLEITISLLKGPPSVLEAAGIGRGRWLGRRGPKGGSGYPSEELDAP